MTVSELIQELQWLQESAGEDLDVLISTENREEPIHTVWLADGRIVIEN